MKANVQIISITEVEEKIDSLGTYIFDVTSLPTYNRYRVPGAHYMEMPFTLNNLPEDNDATLIFYSYDAKCRQSRRAATHAAAYGYKNVFVMKAGIDGWIYGQKPVESGAPSKAAKNIRVVKRKRSVGQL
jgi:rhodanese-related sulfurtransferase